MWFAMADVEKMTGKSKSQLEQLIDSGQLHTRLTSSNEFEIELSSVLNVFAGAQAGVTAVDEMSQRIDHAWSRLWHSSGAH